MPNTSFVAMIVAHLLVAAGEDPESAHPGQMRSTTGWTGLGDLMATVREHLGGDPEAEGMLDVIERDPARERRIEDLAGMVARLAERDPDFLDKIRGLVAKAYADPVVALGLPDPSPWLGL